MIDHKLERADEFINRHVPWHTLECYRSIPRFDCSLQESDHDQRGIKLKSTIYVSSASTSSNVLINRIKLSMWDAHIVIITLSIVLNWSIVHYGSSSKQETPR